MRTTGTGYCGTCLRVNLWWAQKMDTLSQYVGGTSPFVAAQDFILRGEPVGKGDTVQLSTAQAASFIQAGLVTAPTAAAPVVSAKK